MPSPRLAVVTRGLVIPSLVARTRGLVIPSLRPAVLVRGLIIPSLVAQTRGLVIPLLRLAVVTRGLVIPSLVAWTRGLVITSLRLAVVTRGLVAPCIRVTHGYCLRARLVLESLRVVARLKLAPARRPWHAAAPIAGAGAWITGLVAAVVAIVALAVVWPPVPGVRSSAIFVIVTGAAVLAPPPVHLVTAVAVAAPASTPLRTRRARTHRQACKRE